MFLNTLEDFYKLLFLLCVLFMDIIIVRCNLFAYSSSVNFGFPPPASL